MHQPLHSGLRAQPRILWSGIPHSKFCPPGYIWLSGSVQANMVNFPYPSYHLEQLVKKRLSWLYHLAGMRKLPYQRFHFLLSTDSSPSHDCIVCWRSSNFSRGNCISSRTASSSIPRKVRHVPGPSSLFSATGKPSSVNVFNIIILSLAQASKFGAIMRKIV